MKKALTILAGLLVVAVVNADPNMLQFDAVSIQTNGASATVNSPSQDLILNGFIESIIFDLTAGNTDTNTITLYTLAGQGTGAARTVFTASVTADGTYPVRDLATTQAGADISGEPARFPLVGDKLRLTAVNSGADTNAAASTVDVYVIFVGTP
jgi:hypothetical protein